MASGRSVLVSANEYAKFLQYQESLKYSSSSITTIDLMTKQIIGRGHESGRLYILDTPISKSVACFGVQAPFATHCRLGHQPFLRLLKKFCPQ
ncbi:hypothetical protein CsatB_027384 [Cannabis sativa]